MCVPSSSAPPFGCRTTPPDSAVAAPTPPLPFPRRLVPHTTAVPLTLPSVPHFAAWIASHGWPGAAWWPLVYAVVSFAALLWLLLGSLLKLQQVLVLIGGLVAAIASVPVVQGIACRLGR